MNRSSMGRRVLALAVALAIPTLLTISTATAKTAKTDEAAASTDKTSSKEDQAKLKEHNKLRAEIARAKYPATKAEVLSRVKGIKPDDRKWFEETLPDRTYGSSDDVVAALGWEASPAAGDDKTAAPAKKASGSGSSGKGDKSLK